MNQPGQQWARPTNSAATTSMVLGICSLAVCGLLGPFAILQARTAKRQIAATGEGGEGLATAGLVLGWVAVVQLIVVVVALLLLFAQVASSAP